MSTATEQAPKKAKAPPKSKAPAAEKTITIRPLHIGRLNAVIIGDTPLVVHKWSEKAKREMLAKHRGEAAAPKEVKSHVRDMIRSMHWFTDAPITEFPAGTEAKTIDETLTEAFRRALRSGARFGFPALAAKKAMVSACGQIPSLHKTFLRGAVHAGNPRSRIEIIGPPPRVMEAMVRNDGGTADIRYRAEFWPWAAVIPLRYNTSVIKETALVELLNLAGFAVGLLEWRAEKDGERGLFHVAQGGELEAVKREAKAFRAEDWDPTPVEG